MTEYRDGVVPPLNPKGEENIILKNNNILLNCKNNSSVVGKVSNETLDDYCFPMDIYKGSYHVDPEEVSSVVACTVAVQVDLGCDNDVVNICMAKERGEVILDLPPKEQYDAVDALGRLISHVKKYIVKKIRFGRHVEVRVFHCINLSDRDEFLLGRKWITAHNPDLRKGLDGLPIFNCCQDHRDLTASRYNMAVSAPGAVTSR